MAKASVRLVLHGGKTATMAQKNDFLVNTQELGRAIKRRRDGYPLSPSPFQRLPVEGRTDFGFDCLAFAKQGFKDGKVALKIGGVNVDLDAEPPCGAKDPSEPDAGSAG